jgi:hypothetical protein
MRNSIHILHIYFSTIVSRVKIPVKMPDMNEIALLLSSGDK